MDLNEVIDRYCESWSAADSQLRSEILASIWAEGASYSDPTAHVTGRQALLDLIASAHERFPDARIVRTSDIDSHHDSVRFSWALTSRGKPIIPDGLDFVLLNSEGSKIERVIGFFGPLKSSVSSTS